MKQAFDARGEQSEGVHERPSFSVFLFHSIAKRGGKNKE